MESTLSPIARVTGHPPDYHNQCKIEFGMYVQTHEPTTTQWHYGHLVLYLSTLMVTHTLDTTSIFLAPISKQTITAGPSSNAFHSGETSGSTC